MTTPNANNAADGRSDSNAGLADAIEKSIDTLRNEIATLKKRQAISDAGIKHLREIFKTAWTECFYLHYNEKSYETAHKIWPHIKALNEELKFRA